MHAVNQYTQHTDTGQETIHRKSQLEREMFVIFVYILYDRNGCVARMAEVWFKKLCMMLKRCLFKYGHHIFINIMCVCVLFFRLRLLWIAECYHDIPVLWQQEKEAVSNLTIVHRWFKIWIVNKDVTTAYHIERRSQTEGRGNEKKKHK